MPVQLGKDKSGCFARWGNQGAKYHYECGDDTARNTAKQKAHIQGVAIGEYIADKYSFDFDGTLTRHSIQQEALKLINEGMDVYIISARNHKESMYTIADKLGIPHSKIYATGSNANKVAKIKELGIIKHYDANPDVLAQLD